MTTFYHTVDTILYDFFEYRNASGGVTGKVQADFTIQLSSRTAGNVATTGISITEVDATNNAGVYRVTAGLTSFVGDVGDYELTIFDTAAPNNSWAATYKVAHGNTYSSTAALFTATSGDGRVTDGTNPIVGATVDLKTSGGTLVTRVTTDANGDWGPVFLTESVTAFVQKAGYAQASGAITVSGGTATGPGSNIVLATASANAALSASSLWSYARRVARDRTGARSDEVIRSAVNDAITQLSRDLNSQWWYREQDVLLRGSYSTGTVAVTNGSSTVTLTGGTFPGWVADAGSRILLGNRLYEINTRNSDTQVSLEVAYSGDTNAALAYEVVSVSTALPENLLQIKDIFYGQDWVWGSQPVSFMEVVEYQRAYQWTQERSYVWAIAQARIHLWPAPSSDVQVSIVYYAKPAALTVSTDVADVDPIHLDILYRAIDHQIAFRFGDTEGELSAAQTLSIYKNLIKGAESYDRNSVNRPSPVGGRNRRNGLLRGLQVPP